MKIMKQTNQNSDFFALDDKGRLLMQVRFLYILLASLGHWAYMFFRMPSMSSSSAILVLLGMLPILLVGFLLHAGIGELINQIFPQRLPYLRLLLPVLPLVLWYFYNLLYPPAVGEVVRSVIFGRIMGFPIFAYSLAVSFTTQMLLKPPQSRDSSLLDDLED